MFLRDIWFEPSWDIYETKTPSVMRDIVNEVHRLTLVLLDCIFLAVKFMYDWMDLEDYHESWADTESVKNLSCTMWRPSVSLYDPNGLKVLHRRVANVWSISVLYFLWERIYDQARLPYSAGVAWVRNQNTFFCLVHFNNTILLSLPFI